MHLDIFSKWRPEALPFRISGALSRSVSLDELGSKSAPWLCWSLSCLDMSRRMWGGQVVVGGALCVPLMGCGVGQCTRTPHVTFVMLLRHRLDEWLNTSHATRALALPGLAPLSGWTWLVHPASPGAGEKTFLKLEVMKEQVAVWVRRPSKAGVLCVPVLHTSLRVCLNKVN